MSIKTRVSRCYPCNPRKFDVIPAGLREMRGFISVYGGFRIFIVEKVKQLGVFAMDVAVGEVGSFIASDVAEAGAR